MSSQLRVPQIAVFDAERCRDALKTTFQACAEAEFQQLAVLLSCILTCLRPLHQSELEAALILSVDRGCKILQGNVTGNNSRQVCPWHKFSRLISGDSKGFVSLTTASLRIMLSTRQVRGIDQSHVTLARICLNQVDLDGGLHPSASGKPLSSNQFSEYATTYWGQHYRLCERLSPGLAAHVHRLLWTALSTKHDLDTSVVYRDEHVPLLHTLDPLLSRDTAKNALEFCRQNNFGILKERYKLIVARADALLSTSKEAWTSVYTDLSEAFGGLHTNEDRKGLDWTWVVVDQ